MRYTGIQPQYFPRLHYFARILNADIFMIRDDVQFVRKHKYPDGKIGKSFQCHTPIKQSFGLFLLRVPVAHSGFSLLTQTKISNDHGWVKDHLKALQFAYGRSRNFSSLYSEIEEILQFNILSELNIATILWGILHLLGEKEVSIEHVTLRYVNDRLKEQKLFRLKEIRRASQSKFLRTRKNLTANEKIIALCKEIGADEDYCGKTGAITYMDHKIFAKNEIKITVQNWKCKKYQQLFPKQGFIPNLSIIDLLMNVSAKEAVEIING